MNWSITILLISGVLIQLLEKNQVTCRYLARLSICDHGKTGQTTINTKHSICFLKKTYTNGGNTIYERGETNETECMKNAAFSSFMNPDCQLPSPPGNTVCYDCWYCNRTNVKDPNNMPSYMKPVNGTKCLLCSEDKSSSCSATDYTTYGGDRPYCLNEIIYRNGNWTKTLYRCASRIKCFLDDWIDIGNGTNCIQNGVCTHCCQGSNGKPCYAVTEKPTNFSQTQNRVPPTPITNVTKNSTTPTATAKIYCHQCGDMLNGIHCSSRQVYTSQLKECNGTFQYCMTDILQDSNGNLEIYKRCVTDHVCKKEWIRESADQDYCTRYGAFRNPNAFSCHFCCTSDGCNSDVVPNFTTLYN